MMRVKIYGLTALYVLVMLGILTVLNGCNSITTPEGIFESQDNAQPCTVKVQEIDPEQVDAAWDAAATLVGADVKQSQNLLVYWDSQPIEYNGKLYAGLTVPPVIRVLYVGPCVVAQATALVHEFVHMALYLKTGDMDNGHTGHEWEVVPEIGDDLAGQYCGGSMPEFKPSGDSHAE